MVRKIVCKISGGIDAVFKHVEITLNVFSKCFGSRVPDGQLQNQPSITRDPKNFENTLSVMGDKTKIIIDVAKKGRIEIEKQNSRRREQKN